MKLFSNLSSKKIAILIIAFIIVAIGTGIFLYFNNPKMKFMRAINSEYKSLVSLLEQINNSDLAKLSESSTITTSGDVSFKLLLSDQLLEGFLEPFADVINGLKMDYEYASDPQADNSYIKFNSVIDQKDFIDAEMYQMGNKKYIYLNDIYDKYIESESIEVIKRDNNQVEDIMYLSDKIKLSLVSALKTSDFDAEQKQIDINNQIIYADKLTLTLTDERMKEITKQILLDLKEDEKSITIINDLSANEEDAKVVIDKLIKSMDEEVLLSKDVKIIMYVQKDEIVKIEIINGSIMTFEYLSYFTFYPVKKITFFDVDKISYSMTIEKKEQNHVAYEMFFGEQQPIVKGTITKTSKSSIENKTWDMDVSFDLLLLDQSDLLGNLKINTHTTTKVGEKVEMLDISNTIKEEELTEEEKNDIIGKLLEKLFNALPITQVIEEEAEVL